MVCGGDAGTECTHQDAEPDNECRDNLLIDRGTRGSRYQVANEAMLYGSSGLRSPRVGASAYMGEGEPAGDRNGTRRVRAVVLVLASRIPSLLLRFLGRMKRPDIRLAWREKLAIFMLIFILNGAVIFYIVQSGWLLCLD